MAKKMDLGALRQQIMELQIDKELKHDLLEVINEKKHYGLVWEESSEAAWDDMQDQLPVFVEDESKRLDSAPEGSPNHLLIEGDNLNALAALTYAYAEKIDVIYIDPPYNTGNKDFIYNDSFVDKEDGFRHSKWLSFMNRRLKIAKKLLSEKGVIFISIDDNQQAALKLLCDDIYGENNCLVNMVWDLGAGTSAGHFTRAHEYVLVYALNKSIIPNFSGGEGVIDDRALKKKSAKNAEFNYHFKAGTKFEAPDGFELSGEWGGSEKTKLISGRFICENKKLKEDVVLAACWTQKNQMDSFFAGNETFDSKGQKVIEFYFRDNGKLYCRKERDTINPPSVLRNIATTKQGSALLKDMFEGEVVFDFSKPIKLISFLLSLRPKESTILDFFAGSGTTLHATMQLNSEDGGHRKCILVTNNENNICEKVTYERNKRVINGYTNQKGEEVPGLTHNNLRYYKTEFVPRDQSSSKSRRALMASLVDLLCIKNNIYQEQETFGGKKFKKNVLRYFKDEAGQMLVVLDERVVSIIIPMIAEVATRQNPLKVYVYSDGAYAYEDEFHKVMPIIELCAMPDAFLQALEGGTDILPKQKYSEAMMKEFQQNEALAMQNEEVVKEALSDDYDYVLKEKEDNVTNDIID